jgi:outer membrane protein
LYLCKLKIKKKVEKKIVMKKTAVKLLVLAVLFSLTSVTFAQKAVKIGHFNSSDLIKKMPEYAAAQDTLKAYANEIQSELENMQKEVENLSNDYQAKKDQLSALLKSNKEKEINDAYTRMQTFRTNSETDIQNKQADLTQKIFDKVKVAAAKVAKDNHYDYIMESNGVLWYSNDSDDVTSLLEKELKLKN